MASDGPPSRHGATPAVSATEESSAELRALLESFAQAVWETDAAGLVVADSPSWRAYTGQTLGESLGEGWAQAVHPDDRPHALRQWRQAVQAGTPVDVDLRLRAPDGGWRWTNLRAAPIRDADGAVRKWVGMTLDLTARRRAEAGRGAERERLAVAEAIAEERQALIGRIVRAQEEERAQVSREIHDSITQLAHAAALHLDSAVELLDGAPAAARLEVERGRDLARRAAQEARRLIAGLRPEALETHGLSKAIGQEVEALRAAGWPVEYDDGELVGVRLEPEAEIALFRVAQEALSNVRKHARHARLRVRLTRADDVVRLEVRDWGEGFDRAAVGQRGPGEQVGLTSMRERMHLVGGRLEIRTSPEHGTTVRATLPLASAD